MFQRSFVKYFSHIKSNQLKRPETTESYIEGRVVYFTFTFNERPLEHILDYVVRGRY
jgi:hypothetical protein